MAQTGFTPIQLFRTSTAAAAPTAGNLADGELAINLTDEKLYFKNAAGAVKLLASTAGSTGDVVGPASATNNALAAFDGTTGKLIKNASLTANNVLLGNGTGAPLVVAPGTAGNVLSSNGTTWTSAALPAGGLTYVVKTANYTTKDKEGVLADTSGGAFTVTLPATPATGAQVVIADSGNAWGTNNLTVGRNSSTIGGLAENLICDITGASVQFVYDGTTWEVYAQIGGQGGNAVTLDGVQTLTNKTINIANNTLTGVQPTLVSGTNIKTINGGSVLGSGDLTVGGGSMIFLSSVTASNSTTVDIETTFDSTYDEYVILISALIPVSAGAGILMRGKVGGVYVTTGSSYFTAIPGANSTGTSTLITANGSDQVYLTQDCAQGAYMVRVHSPANTSIKKFFDIYGSCFDSSSSLRSQSGSAMINLTSALTGVRFYTDLGNISTGTFRLYGIKKS